MDWNNFKANDSRGAELLYGMMQSEQSNIKQRELFTEFTLLNGYSAWHIHNGWVMSGALSGDILHLDKINITWIERDDDGYSHSPARPIVGDKIIVVEDSPNINITTPFDLYCFEVINVELGTSRSCYVYVNLIETKQAVFNKECSCYEFYNKNKWNIISWLKNEFKK